MALKNPHITNSVARVKASSKLVWNIFADRPWVLTVAETKQNSIEDAQGFDMFVKVVNLFGSVLKLDGKDNVLSVQIKSSERSVTWAYPAGTVRVKSSKMEHNCKIWRILYQFGYQGTCYNTWILLR